MGRRTSGGQVGLEKIGLVQANAATLTTTQTNANLTLDPNGTGVVQVNSDTMHDGTLTMMNQAGIRFREATANGTNYIQVQAASNMAANYTITWPAAVASSSGFVLSSDTSGNLSWSSAGGNIAVSDPGASATVHYPLFDTASGSLPTTLAPKARTNLSFVPSTGELISTIATHPTLRGSTSNSGTITINGTSSATKATASVLMTDNVASSTVGTGTLVVTGGVGISGQITAATIVETSSVVFKTNIEPLENALDTVLKLVGVTYDRRDTKQHEAGLIAEQVFKYAPDLVSLDTKGKPYGIKYTKITAYLVEAIKELKSQLEELKSSR
jgi:hypothetical protein